MKQEFLARLHNSDETVIELGLGIAPGVAITESFTGEGFILLHARSGCAIGPSFEHPEQAAHAFQMHLAQFDWTRPGSEIVNDLEVLMAVRGIAPECSLTHHRPSYFKDIA